jgi:flagellar biosynthetic protein FliR
VIELTSAQLEALAGALLFPLIRILALAFSAPLLSQLPLRIRVALALVLASLAAAAAGAPPPALEAPQAVLAGLREAAIGFALGLLLRLIFAAAQIAGDVIGMQMGLGFAYFVDPQGSGQSPVVGSLYAVLAGMLFFALDIHLLVIGGLIESFQSFPAGALGAQPQWHTVAAAGGEMFRLALSISLPTLTGLLLANMALGMLSRSAPQLNLFAVGFPAMLVVGFLLLGPTLPGALDAISRALAAWPGGGR